MDSSGVVLFYPKRGILAHVSEGFIGATYILLGLMAHLSLKSTLYSVILLAETLGVEEIGRWYFATNLTALLLFLFLISSILTFLFIPLNSFYLCIAIWILPVFHLIQMINLGFVAISIAKYVYVIIASILCMAAASVNMIAMAKSAEVPSGKYRNETLMVLVGHAMGDLGTQLIVFILELQSEDLDTSDIENSVMLWLFSTLPILTGSILVSIYLHYRNFGLRSNEIYRENINIKNATKEYKIARSALNYCLSIASVIWIVQIIEGFFNTGAEIVTVDAFPQIKNSVECTLILAAMAISDILGRGTVILANIVVDNINKYGLSLLDPGTIRDLKHYAKYLWIPILFVRIPSALLLLLSRHYRHSLGMFLETNAVTAISTLNRLLRGALLGITYTSLYGAAHEGALKFYNLPARVSDHEPFECIDQRATSANSAVLVVPLVYLIEITMMLVAVYLGFKYQILIFEAEREALENLTWPTDFTERSDKKFLYWIFNMLYLVDQDIRHPFGLCK